MSISTTPQRLKNVGACIPESIPSIQVVDVGALWLGEEPYGPLVRNGLARVLGFEPIAAECDTLNQKFGPQHRYLPYAIGDGTRRRFHRCAHSMTSSLYEPDLECMGMYHNLPHFCQVEESWEVQTVRLDDIPGARAADYLKLDVQGAELDVLRGAEETLRSVVVIQTEVEFVPIYRGQPLFADVDRFLRMHGFMFHRFEGTEGRVLQTVPVRHDNEQERRQLLWADAVYIRDIARWSDLTDTSLLKFAAILHELYGSFDFVAKLLQFRDQRHGGHSWRPYLVALGIPPEV